MRHGVVVWLTGLPCCGKSTVANALATKLRNPVILDGDIVRLGVSKDLDFSDNGRKNNIIRVGHIAKLLSDNGHDVICALISPFSDARDHVRGLIGHKFIEVFVDTPIEVCIERDVKGMYKKAMAGEIKQFTGISSPYEPPTHPNLVCNTTTSTLDSCVDAILKIVNVKCARALYIGRWQPFHDGHKYIIDDSLSKGIPVLIGIRDMYHDGSNPYESLAVKDRIETFYKDKDVEVVIIPDIASINIGRNVGYGVNYIDAPQAIKDISATKIREGMSHNKS